MGLVGVLDYGFDGVALDDDMLRLDYVVRENSRK